MDKLSQPRFVGYYRFAELSGIDWMMVLDVPFVENNIEFFAALPIACVGIAVVLCFASIFFFCCSCCMFSSLNTTIIQAKKVEIMDLDNKIFSKKRSIFTEIATVQQSFAKMVIMLKEFKPFIPMFVLQKVRQSNNNDNKAKKSNFLKSSGSGKLQTRSPMASNKKVYPTSLVPQNSFLDNESVHSQQNLATSNSGSSKLEANMNAFSLGFKSKFVTIVHCKIANLRAELRQTRSDERRLSVKDLEEQHSRVMEIFLNSVGLVQGCPVEISFGHFSMMIVSGKQSEKAISFATKLQKKILELNRKFELRGEIPFQIHIGIAQSECLCGNVGSRKSKHFSVVGVAVDQASILANSVKRVFKTTLRSQKENKSGLDHTICLVTSSIYIETCEDYVYRQLGVWEYKNELTQVHYLLKEKVTPNADENWINGQQAENASLHNLVNEGFVAIKDGKFEEAAEKYSDFLELMMETPSSRALGNELASHDDLAELLKFLIDTKQTKLVVKGLSFSNGRTDDAPSFSPISS